MDDRKRRIGLRDKPISSEDEDALGVKEYSEALAEFIIGCDTPMTIAIQGDWGSGKTGLMKLVERKLGEDVIPIEFNTWQYSQFDLAGDLPVLMMTHFTEQVAKDLPKDLDEKLADGKAWLWRNLKGFGTIAVSTAARSVSGDAGAKAVGEIFGSNSPLKGLQSLRDGLKLAVKRRSEKAGGKKIVVFVDDLDRLVPAKAVELLEVMKLFLDIEGCVFVLACDYEVIRRGVSDKFGHDSEAGSGKSFFDKIIQLPFHMPTGLYKVQDYLSGLLKTIDFECSPKDLEDYLSLLHPSLGLNPRNLKRLFNQLTILEILHRKQLLHKDVDLQSKIRGQKILFGIECMQQSFGKVHLLLTREMEGKLVSLLEEGLRSRESIQRLDHRHNLFPDTADKDKMIGNLLRFMQTFTAILQMDKDARLSRDEIDNFKQFAKLASVTSGSDSGHEDGDLVHDAITGFCRLVRDQLRNLPEEMRPTNQSKWAKGDRDRRYYALWPKPDGRRKVWWQWGLSYFVEFDRQHWDEIWIGLWFNPMHLRGCGISQERIDGLRDLAIIMEAGFEYCPQADNWTLIRKRLGTLDYGTMEQPNLESVRTVAQEMRTIIEATHDLFDVEEGQSTQ